jgi:HEAT repeat protein
VRTPRPITVQPRAASIFGGPSEGPSLGEVAARAAETQKTQPMVLPASRIQGVPELIPQTVSQEMTRPRPDLPKLDLNVLLELLDDTGLRRDVALEVCRRKEAFGCGPVFGALRRMTRGEAVRVLPAVVQFGERAVPHLVDGLRSRKAYLRQGCALALGVLKSADGIDPLCDLLLSEPTDVWREIARAIGEIGPGVVMSLAARVRDPLVRGEGVSAEARERLAPEARERIAWALAHVAARGGRGPIDTLAGGRDPVASGVAKRALELSLAARDNDAEVRGPNPPRDQTVNRAFSRRFFEAMNGGSSSANLRAAAGESSGTIPLDDSQIVEGDDESLGEEDILADR